MTEWPPRDDVQVAGRPTNWTLISLVAGLVLLIILVAYFATNRRSNPDKLTSNQVASSTAPNHEKLCAGQATYDLIKHELFRRAAQLRGTDQAAFDQVSSAAVVRMENPVMENEDSSTHAVNCSGSLSLDLPPGIAVVGGRRTLTSDVDYTVQQAADNSGAVVLLRNADAIIAPLATLARLQQPAPAVTTVANNQAGEGIPQAAAPSTPATPMPVSPSPATARPNAGCAPGGSRGQSLVCSDPRLTALDRAAATEYSQALGVATPEMRDTLRQTQRRFRAYRDGCADAQCVAQAYSDRVREIRDIVEGRWQPPQ